MLPDKINRWIISLFICVAIARVSGSERKLSSQINPGCKTCSAESTLLYVKSTGSEDAIHQIWDFTRGIPTIIYSVASINSSIDIVWDNQTPREFRFSEKPAYSFAVVLDKLYEYNDLEDDGQLDPHSKTLQKKGFSLRPVSWRLLKNITGDDEAMVQLEGRNIRLHSENGRDTGVIGVKLDLLSYTHISTNLPHLIHTSNSTLVDLSLVNLTSSAEYNASRFAWHAIFLSTDSAMDSMHCIMRKSLDDEHTPGVFEMIEIKTPASYTSGAGGFAQFRPVAYTASERAVTTSTVVHVSQFDRALLPRESTVQKFYRNFDKENILMQEIYISFGETGDGFYTKHNYTDWSFTIGYGSPPVEGVSLFVILVIAIGLGVPVLLASSGIAYVVTRRLRQRNDHRRFTDDQ